VRIATFNINGVKRRLDNLLDWLGAIEPDIVCLQELKVAEADFPRAAIESAGYGAVWCSQSAWNGVAILARDVDPVLVRTELPGDPSDLQRRYIEAAVRGILVASIYAPNGNPQPGPKFDYKLAWLKRLRLHADELLASGVPAVLAGDYNVAPEPEDVYPTSSYDNDALVQPRSRAAFRQLTDKGWVDAVRRCHPNGRVYTFWDYRRKRWERDAGLRLDHLLLGGAMIPRLTHAGVDRSVRGKEGASDHAPVWIEIG
jgi:exodeoxyribonuclease III